MDVKNFAMTNSNNKVHGKGPFGALFFSQPPINLLLIGITLLILSAVCILIVHSRSWPLIWDCAMFHYVAWLITEGLVPYRDIFDVQFPGTYIIHILITKIPGSGDVQWRVFDLACLGVIDALILLYCRPFGRLAGWLGVALFTSFHLFNGPLYAGQRDYVLLTFMLAGLYCTARHMESNSLVLASLGGLMLGAAASVKPYIGLLCVVTAAALIFHAWQAKSSVLKTIAAFALSAALVPGALLLWLAVTGGLLPFFDILFHYLLPLYSKFSFFPFTKTVFYQFLGIHYLEMILLLLVAGVDLLLCKEHRYRRSLLVVGVMYGFFHYYFQVRNHYQLYPMALCLFLLIASWTSRLQGRGPLLLRCLMAVILLHAAVTALTRSAGNIATPPASHITKFRCTTDLLHDLQEKILPGQTVQAMDSTSGDIHALFKLKVKQPTRFIYDAHFFHDMDHPYIQMLRCEFLHDLATAPPDWFVLSEVSWPVYGYERLHQFPELATWLTANYTLEVERHCYRLYRKK